MPLRIRRRVLVAAAPAAILVGPPPAYAIIPLLAAIAAGLLEALKQAGEVAESLQKAVSAGLRMRTEIADAGDRSARKEKLRLAHEAVEDISRHLMNLAMEQGPLANRIRAYVGRPDPAQWPAVARQVDEVVRRVRDVSALLAAASPRLPVSLSPQFEALATTLAARSSLLQQLQQLTPPVDNEDVQALAVIADAYDQLRANLRTINTELATYAEGA